MLESVENVWNVEIVAGMGGFAVGGMWKSLAVAGGKFRWNG